jgi:hypothetical protein
LAKGKEGNILIGEGKKEGFGRKIVRNSEPPNNLKYL